MQSLELKWKNFLLNSILFFLKLDGLGVDTWLDIVLAIYVHHIFKLTLCSVSLLYEQFHSL